MMTPEELALIELTARLWNAFMELPNRHPADGPEMARDLHNIQNRIMARAAARAHPESFKHG